MEDKTFKQFFISNVFDSMDKLYNRKKLTMKKSLKLAGFFFLFISSLYVPHYLWELYCNSLPEGVEYWDHWASQPTSISLILTTWAIVIYCSIKFIDTFINS